MPDSNPPRLFPQFTELELRRFDGETGPKYIAYNGKVYDVTNCPKWKGELHENLHYPGIDLTGELDDAPHGSEVFDRQSVKLVGYLIGYKETN